MGFVITIEPDDSEEFKRISRRELAQKLGCHFNTLRKDELLIKEWVDDARKLYRESNPNKLDGTPLRVAAEIRAKWDTL